MENKEVTKGIPLKIFQFNKAYEAPTYKYNEKLGLIEWGKDNQYPVFILNLYNTNGSSTHKSIVNKKVKLIAGQGFEDILSPELKQFVKDNKLTKEVKKIALDYELFNGFCFEIIWNNEGSQILYLNHIPYHKIRLGIKTPELNFDHYWFSNDWSQIKKPEFEPEYIRAYEPNLRQGKQLYYHSEYNPQTDGLYPIVGYSTSINWIEMDYEISKFHLNQVKQGYAPSFLLNFSTGIPTEEEQDEFFKEFKKNFSGAENAGKIIITYSEGVEQKPELIPIQLNDTDERFIMLMEQIENNIVRGSEIPPQIVLLTPGKLGSSQERSELLDEFQAAYITPRQETIEECLNEVLYVNGYNEELILAEYQLQSDKTTTTNSTQMNEFKKWRSNPNSSNVDKILYNDESMELVIKFNDGDIYTYYNVPFQLFNDIFTGNGVCRTEGSNQWGEWYVGKTPSVGAAVYQRLVESNIKYKKGGSLK